MRTSNCAACPPVPASQLARLVLRLAAGFTFLLLLAAAPVATGDEVRLQNGDRYLGQVISLDSKVLVLQSEVLGAVRLPREKVSVITLGSAAANPSAMPANASQPGTATGASTKTANSTIAPVGGLGVDSNVVRQIQAQLLSSGGAEANAKFKDMLGGYLSGRLSVSDVRAQAQAAADQIKQLKGELGDEAGGMLDGYLSILEKFLDEAKPPIGATNSVRDPQTLKAKPETARPASRR